MTVVDKSGVLMIRMSPDEAVATIQSISSQILGGSSNVGRLETFLTGDGRDFSIAVDTKPYARRRTHGEAGEF